jgi:hypothetical protein
MTFEATAMTVHKVLRDILNRCAYQASSLVQIVLSMVPPQRAHGCLHTAALPDRSALLLYAFICSYM